MKNSLKVNFILVITILLAFACCGVTFAWFSGASEIDTDIDSSVLRSYFESGSGKTADDPYIIHTPRQLYNLAWLQYMGKFNEAENGKVTQYYFELCDGYSGHTGLTELDMTGWTLPPIGTPENPFVGHFEGNGITISNLTISGNFDDLSNPGDNGANFANSAYANANKTGAKKGCDIVGLFGVVGNPSGNAGQLGAYTYTSSVNSVQNLNVKDITVKTQTSTSLIGIVAGYVNGNVSGVGVVNSSVVAVDTAAISGITSNISDYATIGYCTEPYVNSTKNIKVEIGQPTIRIRNKSSAEGGGDQWGGSYSMQNLYNRLNDMRDEAEEITVSYVQTETIVTKDGETTRTEVLGYDTYQGNWFYNYKNRKSTEGGSATFYIPIGASFVSQYANYEFLSGRQEIQKHTKTTEIYTTEVAPAGAFYIHVDNTYMGLTNANGSSATIISCTGFSSATRWTFVEIVDGYVNTTTESSGYLRARINDTDYFLNGNGTTLSVSTTASTKWSFNNQTNELSFVQGSRQAFLCYSKNGKWEISVEQSSSEFVIADSSMQNFLTITGSGVLSNTQNSLDAVSWTFETEDGQTVVKARFNNNTYYLSLYGSSYFGYSLKVDRSNASRNTTYGWSKKVDASNPSHLLLTCILSETSAYNLVFNGSSWTTEQASIRNTYILKNGNGYYLSASATNDSDVKVVASKNSASRWETNGRSVFTTIDGTVYYLYRSGDTNSAYIRVSSSSSSASSWSWNDGYIFNGAFLYIINDGTSRWKIHRYYGGYEENEDGCVKKADKKQEITNTPNIYYVSKGDLSHASVAIHTTTEDLPYTSITKNKETITTYTPDTYIPLASAYDFPDESTSSDPYAVLSRNTGYITSGNHNSGSTELAGYNVDKLRGDVRVSKYDMSSINVSLNQDSYSSSKLQVITKTYKTNNALVRINDDYNSNSSVSSKINGLTYSSYANLGLEKYKDSRKKLEDIFNLNGSASSYIYGIHFMNAAISISNKFTIPYAVINGTVYEEGYELPEDCIDCNLAQKGYINFFAGTFTDSNLSGNPNSFFSLHEITRDASGSAIVSIREIVKIYGDPNHPDKDYLYEYSGGSTPSLPTGYVLMFNTDWIKNPFTGYTTSNLQNCLFYYEVPVNAGEYALGSVSESGKVGAYLVYLDIAVNPISATIEETTEYFKTVEECYTYPKGVQIVETPVAPSAVNPVSSVAIELSNETGNGGMNISRSGNTVTVTSVSGISVAYSSKDITVMDSNGQTLYGSPKYSTEVSIERKTTIENNLEKGTSSTAITEIVVTKVNGVETSRIARNGTSGSGTATTTAIDNYTVALACNYLSNNCSSTPTITNEKSSVPLSEFKKVGTDWTKISYADYISIYNIIIGNTQAVTVYPTVVNGMTGHVYREQGKGFATMVQGTPLNISSGL